MPMVCDEIMKVCLDIPFLYPSPSKCIIVLTVMDYFIDRLGAEPILSVKKTVTIDIRLILMVTDTETVRANRP